MNEQGEQISAEELQKRILKQRFSNRIAQLEDENATLQTNLALANQRIQQLEQHVAELSSDPNEPDNAESA